MTEDMPGTGPVENVHEAFVYHRPDAEGVTKIEEVRKSCGALYEVLVANVPASAERTLAIRKLEEVSMWANKSIVFNGRRYLGA